MHAYGKKICHNKSSELCLYALKIFLCLIRCETLFSPVAFCTGWIHPAPIQHKAANDFSFGVLWKSAKQQKTSTSYWFPLAIKTRTVQIKLYLPFPNIIPEVGDSHEIQRLKHVRQMQQKKIFPRFTDEHEK
ncbi:hypothetical protein GDO86_011222 [Hymenochirus boettgeri]|uniref:Uncharacterized protein n=1 Tax=Hymenochirus boettgeri TaxID=247094 RepID=A0A8T2JG95_9PIPI|nr:hypothetical protein GDO86_011222 [Hymenochirus boettgeri]